MAEALISHALIISFSILLILVVVTSLNTIRGDYKDFIGNIESKQVCGIIKEGIEKIYSPYKSFTLLEINYTAYGSIVLSLPEKIADARYRARLANDSIIVELIGEEINHTCASGFGLNMSGTSPGGMTRIEWQVIASAGISRERIVMQRA